MENIWDVLGQAIFRRLPTPASLRLKNCPTGEIANTGLCDGWSHDTDDTDLNAAKRGWHTLLMSDFVVSFEFEHSDDTNDVTL